jgi:hypothetical protein
MRTLIVSDLHLGSVSGADLLRHAELRAPLLEAVADAERVVLLGDVLELRHGPPRDALAVARGVFEDLGKALAGGELVILAGNHDHAMVEPWLARRSAEDEPAPLGLERLLEPALVSPMLARLADWAAPARVQAAYPGIWVRRDVYATHGHYLDCHLTVPTLERLSMSAMSRVLGRPAAELETTEDYEAVGSPVYAWRDAVARDGRTGAALNGLATVTVWRALGGGSDRDASRDGGVGGSLAASLRRRALAAGFPLAVAALNRAGLGPVRADISAGELRRAGLAAMGEVAVRLGLRDAYVIFGHTHRAGPLRGDRHHEWLGPAGARLINAGCWTYAPVFLTSTPGESPYWPGACVLVEDTGPPELRRLLQDRTHAELRPRAPLAPAPA